MLIRLGWLTLGAVMLAALAAPIGCGRSPLFSMRSDGGLDTKPAGNPDGRSDGVVPPMPDAAADARDGAADGRADAPTTGDGRDGPSDVRDGATEASADTRLDGASDARDGGADVVEAGRDASVADVPPADARPEGGQPDAAADRPAVDASADVSVPPDAGVERPLMDAAIDLLPPLPDAGDGGPTTPCDLVRQDCPAGQRCDVAVGASGTLGVFCIPDRGGSAVHGAACGNGPRDCRRGATCLQDVDRNGNPIGAPRCNDFCAADANCPAGSTCIQSTLFDEGQRLPVGICWP